MRITGLPTGHQTEQALIFVPPGQNPHGILQTNSRNKESVVKRWSNISRMLDIEAMRLSSNSCMADGLRSLAKAPLSSAIKRMHKAGRTFGILDVIVTSRILHTTVKSPSRGSKAASKSARRATTSTSPLNASPPAPVDVRAKKAKRMPRSPRTSCGKHTHGESFLYRQQTSNMRPRQGYILTFEPPQRTVEEEFREIQTAAESPSKEIQSGRAKTKRTRSAHSKTPGLVIKDVSLALHFCLACLFFEGRVS